MSRQQTWPSVSDDRGATLIEIIVVLAILALMVGSIAPVARGGAQRAKLGAAAHQLVAKLSDVRLAAMQLGREQTVWIDPARRRYWAKGIFSPVSLASGLSLQIASEDADAARRSVHGIRFFPSGAASEAILALGSGSASVRIAVDPLTGIARVAR